MHFYNKIFESTEYTIRYLCKEGYKTNNSMTLYKLQKLITFKSFHTNRDIKQGV